MTKEQKQKISNRLVFNFGMLLLGAVILLYVRSGLMGYHRGLTFKIILVVEILSILAAAIFFFCGKKRFTKLKKYSGVFLGVFIASFILRFSSHGLISLFTWERALALVYILMAAYFVVMSVITYILLRKPVIKPVEERELLRKKYAKKKRRK